MLPMLDVERSMLWLARHMARFVGLLPMASGSQQPEPSAGSTASPPGAGALGAATSVAAAPAVIDAIRAVLRAGGDWGDQGYCGPPADELPGSLPPAVLALLEHRSQHAQCTPEVWLPARRWLAIPADPVGNRAMIEAIVAQLQDHLPDAVNLIDLGAGAGLISADLLHALPQLRAVLVDTPEALAQARRILIAMGSRVEFHAADLLEGALPTDRFDVAMLVQVLHLCDAATRQRLLTRAAQMLKPGGLLVVGELASETLTGAFYRLTATLIGATAQELSEEILASEVRAAGFKLVTQRVLPGATRLLVASWSSGQPSAAAEVWKEMYQD